MYAPTIQISFEETASEPFFPCALDDALLTPPAHTPKRTLTTGRGLERDQFDALLRVTRRSSGNVSKSIDLRKEVALKAYKSKQAERRAFFLSKITAPPSPTATDSPKTPPDSPSVFHYSLPSPGLDSPIQHFETKGRRAAWVEQVDYKRPSNALPSLEQISARMQATSARFKTVGRLRLPIRQASTPQLLVTPPQPQLQITTTRVPHSSPTSSPSLTKENLTALNSRERTARDMISTLRRRSFHTQTVKQAQSSVPFPSMDSQPGAEERKLRRISAPAEMQSRGLSQLSSFSSHPILF